MHIQARNTSSSGANLGFVIFRRGTAPDVKAIDRLAAGGPDLKQMKTRLGVPLDKREGFVKA